MAQGTGQKCRWNKMRRFSSLFLAGLALTVLSWVAGPAAAQAPDESGVPEETVTVVPVEPTVAPEPTVSPINVVTPEPTVTSTDSVTPTPTPEVEDPLSDFEEFEDDGLTEDDINPCAAFEDEPDSPDPDDPENSDGPEEPVVVRPPAFTLVNGRCIPVAELARLLAGYEGAVAEEAEALIILREALEIVDELQTELDNIERDLGLAKLRTTAAEAEVRYANMRVELAQAESAIIEEELADNRIILRNQAVAFYITGGPSRVVEDTLSNTDDVNEVGSIRVYGSVIVEQRVLVLERVSFLDRRAKELAQSLEAARSDAEVAAADRVLAERFREAIRDYQRQVLSDAIEATEEQAEVVSSIQERRDSFADDLGLSAASGSAISLVLQPLGDGTASLADVEFMESPLEITRVSSGFGPRLHPIFGEVRLHSGLDFSSPAGAPIFATAPGTVVIASAQGGYGNAVVIDHGGGIATLYAHMSAFASVVGDEVETGDTIGFVGSTGFSTGPHLHFELRLDGLPVDALSVVDIDGTEQ